MNFLGIRDYDSLVELLVSHFFSITVLSAHYWPWMPSSGWAWLCLIVMVLLGYHRVGRQFFGFVAAILTIVLQGNLIRNQSNVLYQAGPDIIIKGRVDSFLRKLVTLMRVLSSFIK